MTTSVAVTGAKGRLGRALVPALEEAGFAAVSWSRPEYDLDDPGSPERLIATRPDHVIHAAAWTDVDACALEPEMAMRRNAQAVDELARATARAGARLVLISTNEVFDGERADGEGYSELEPQRPINPYGASKLAGEHAARRAYDSANRSNDLLIVRTAWLFGPPGNDFPYKIVAAADRLPADQPLKVVADEIGSPTYTLDLARAVAQLLVAHAPGGTYHLVNEGAPSRLEVAQRVLRCCRPDRQTVAISRREFSRPSTPPAWAVLQNVAGREVGIWLRPWQDAVDDYAPSLCAAPFQ